MRLHPGEEVTAGRVKTLAVRKNLSESVAGALHQLGQTRQRWTIRVPNESQIVRKSRGCHAVDSNVANRRVAQNDEAREVQLSELAKRHEGVMRVGDARSRGHTTE